LLIISLLQERDLKKDKEKINEADSKIDTAYHEAGHAAVCIFYKINLTKVSIMTDCEGYAGHIEGHKKDIGETIRNASRKKLSVPLLEHIQMQIAGSKAASMLRGVNKTLMSAGPDFDFVEKLYRKICIEKRLWGLEMLRLNEWLEVRTQKLLTLIWPAVVAIANELMIKGEITGKRAKHVYNSVKIHSLSDLNPDE
jgi:hypothetical protein